ncbi:hypothetical protein COT44_00995 [Candidatus Shapirobacteria bacterium CG08_land_8_20_14_0_20_39_18]|uniref:Glycosyltransferase 2-like domain-containing protein n=1 Tax=Candidatus Shapirobacteria bacterium CG08_land_8_20_14_0_20_39_18 TaxID=1974883 RepID=A0A2M6XDV5_9BACT|nr:MAG: hypothetical protein COT44_00995 [Candidatus Shapirobacteria bacterium CG08_land_8_20_14_0_20_39_18]PJE68627.1 MAG: hypothetical protein COU94_01070 [Candidatus Shapirobacteria bacterium CG10_big_fil_rev_8_21_14_0_10_38_8]
MKTSIVIPNWNGKELLEKNLPAMMAVNPDETIIVDNASVDGSIEFLEEKYPEIILIKNSVNLGFALGCNQGVKKAKNELVVLLNNDVVPENDAISNAVGLFKDHKLFAVSFHEPQWSWARIFWKNGYIEHEPGIGKSKTHISAWASGGSGIFRKLIWEELGGFDDLYAPFYWEDIDLSYRSWKRGYKVLWEPKAIVHHKHEGTIGKHFSKDYVSYISERNRLFFIWKNVSDTLLFSDHKKQLLFKLLTKPGYWKPFLSALKKLPVILKKRQEEKQNIRITDNEIFEQF